MSSADFEAFDMLVAATLTAHISDIAHCEFRDLATNGCRPPQQYREHLPEEVQYLDTPRTPYQSRTDSATRAYQMGVRETREIARANETAADFGLIAPFDGGFNMAWGPVFLALILDRNGDFLPTARPPGGVRVFLASGDDSERVACTPQCDFGAQQTGILVIAGTVDSEENDEYCSLLTSNCVMKVARLLDPAQGGNLQLMNASIRSDKSFDVSVYYFSGEPQNLKINIFKTFFNLASGNDLQRAITFMANFLDRHIAECKFAFMAWLQDTILNCPAASIPSRSALLRGRSRSRGGSSGFGGARGYDEPEDEEGVPDEIVNTSPSPYSFVEIE